MTKPTEYEEKLSEFSALRELLLQPERDNITELNNKIAGLEHKLLDKKENTIHFSQMIAETIQTRIEKDNDLQNVLKPIIREALYEMIDKNPNVVITAFLNAYKTQDQVEKVVK